jgi:hypothetical protein
MRVTDPGRRRGRVQVDSVADLGQAAERMQDLLRLAEEPVQLLFEVERERADVAVLPRPT